MVRQQTQTLEEAVEGRPAPPDPAKSKISELTAYCKEVGEYPEGWKGMTADEKRTAFNRLFRPGEARTDTFDSEDVVHLVAERVENLDRDDVKPAIERLSDSVGQGQFELGGVLARVTSEGWYQELGYENFKQFVEAETGFKLSKARYLVANYTRLVELDIPFSEFDGIGWWKVGILLNGQGTPILTRDNVAAWVEKAKFLTSMQLREEVRAAARRADSGEEGEDASSSGGGAKQKAFKLHADQLETIEAALTAMREQVGDDKTEAALLENICIEWMELSAGAKKAAPEEETPESVGRMLHAAMRRLRELADDDYKAAEVLDAAFGKAFPKTSSIDIYVEG